MKTGYRKFTLGLVYMAGMFAIGILVVLRHSGDLMGVGAMATGVATGVGVVCWGNAQEWKAKNGQQQKAQ